jgi:ABC-type nitrate/sulfonate/bicarbonate transport system permease component
MTAQKFEEINEYLLFEDVPARIPGSLANSSDRTMQIESIVLTATATLVVCVLGFVLGWQLAAILAVAMVVKRIGAARATQHENGTDSRQIRC